MPDQEDFRMDHSDILDCKLALMGVWTQACREAAAYFGVNPDGCGSIAGGGGGGVVWARTGPARASSSEARRGIRRMGVQSVRELGQD